MFQMGLDAFSDLNYAPSVLLCVLLIMNHSTYRIAFINHFTIGISKLSV